MLAEDVRHDCPQGRVVLGRGGVSQHDLGADVEVRIGYPPGRPGDLAQPQAQFRCLVQAGRYRRAQRRQLDVPVQQHDLAGVPGHMPVLERQDGQVLARQRAAARQLCCRGRCPAPRPLTQPAHIRASTLSSRP